MSDLDTADRQEPTEALAAKTAHLKEKIAKIGEEMKKLDAIEKQMLASPDQQISLTDPDARSMATSGRGSGMVGYNVQIWISTRSSLRGDAKIRRAVAEVCSVMLPDCHELVVFGHGEGFAHRAVEAVDDRLPSMTSAVPIIGVLRIVPLIVLRKPTASAARLSLLRSRVHQVAKLLGLKGIGVHLQLRMPALDL